MIKKVLISISILGLLAFLSVVYMKNQVEDYINQPLNIESETLYTLSSGASFNRTLAQLSEQNIIHDSLASKIVSRLYPQYTSVKAGTYLIKPGNTLAETLTLFVSGDEHHFSLTFVEGSTFKEWRKWLNEAPNLTHDTQVLTEAEIAAELGIEQQKLEGLFLAETYYYTFGMSDLEILKKAHKQLTQSLELAWAKKQNNLPLKDSYEALILASIIEKETAVESERRRVSSVFVNRLNKGMRLQTDPTVIYGMGDKYDGDIRKKDLRTPTPYNTYTINGLPPTPIAMPGKASIEAAVNPEASKYLYFVASGKGGHVFTTNLKAHNRAVRAYLKELRKKK
ncbi:endolytic transglycosylase MltG [Vibrio sp.]|nr:endolytic transglycosylase MltG [Vibrio sp.]